MSHTATILDFKRILKYRRSYFLDADQLYNLYESGNMVISDLSPLNFCYPVRYYDGTLIRYFSSDLNDVLDMCNFLSNKLNGKIYVPHISRENKESFISSGFRTEYKITSLYKYDYLIKPKDIEYHFIDYTNFYYDEVKSIDIRCFPKSMELCREDIIDFSKDKNTHMRICIIDNIPVGFSLFKINYTIGYGSIIKIAVTPDFQRLGIGTLILKDISETLRSNDIFPIFIDNIFEDSIGFFMNNGFKIWCESYLFSKVKGQTI